MYSIDESLALIASYAHTCARERFPLPFTNPFEYPKKSSPAVIAIAVPHIYKVRADDDDDNQISRCTPLFAIIREGRAVREIL